MSPKSKTVSRKRPGRLATGLDHATAIGLGPEMRVRLDEWAKENGLNSRSEAIRRLVEHGLNAGNLPDEPNPRRTACKAAAQTEMTAPHQSAGLS